MHSFQEIIFKLTEFWANNGCVVHQGHDIEVGAGTFNPATFFRCLDPQPYNTVYVEPSRRPQDGRYGENPNRLQLFHQLQVIMKPSPLNIQELYLKSLEVIGLDLSKHDIRFVHDDWESPTLGAWGLGWEVWMDGMEITQFTYFQAMASASLNPIPVELTYGLERIAMLLQNKQSFFEMNWSPDFEYGKIIKQNEVEWSRYNFKQANTEMWKRHFVDYQLEAKHAIENQLPIPAYDFILKSSHAFNILEARGVLSTAERTNYIAKIRDLARECALEFLKILPEAENPEHSQTVTPKSNTFSFDPAQSSDFLFEIGSEELPAAFVPIGIRSLKQAFEHFLKTHQLAHHSLVVEGTPKRLTVFIKNLSQGQQEQKVERRGPPLSFAFDNQGQATKQGQGFLRSLGIENADLHSIRSGKFSNLSVKTIKDTEYLWAIETKPALATAALLQQSLSSILSHLSFPKKMRWATIVEEYPRPLKWLVCLFGNQLIPFEYAQIKSSRISYGHSQRKPQAFEVNSIETYFDQLQEHFVEVRVENRKQAILTQLQSIEKQHDLVAIDREKVLPQVLFLSEWPELVIEEFSASFLSVPQEILRSEMVEHQKYFPLTNKSGALSNHFVITADQTISPEILKGNQAVLSARLKDGLFLYKEDRSKPFSSFVEELHKVVFHQKIGTMHEKALRIEYLAKHLAKVLQKADENNVEKAAILCKADLATELVGEFPELQGTIGKYYALESGETQEVALAIEEHWMPTAEKAPLPSSDLGSILSIADKLDNLCCYFSIGLKPSSSSDPFALRRQTLGVMKILIEKQFSLDFSECIRYAIQHLNCADQEMHIHEIEKYCKTRLQSVFEEMSFKKDEISAILASGQLNPFDLYRRLHALHRFRNHESFLSLIEVFKRVYGQLKDQPPYQVDPQLFSENAESLLWGSIESLIPKMDQLIQKGDYSIAFEELSSLKNPLSKLFKEVRILAEDEKQRKNRLALLQSVLKCCDNLLDFAQLQR